MSNKSNQREEKPASEKYRLTQKLAREEASSNAKIHPNLPTDNKGNIIASKNVWTPTHGPKGKEPLRNESDLTHTKTGRHRATAGTINKGAGPLHNADGRKVEVHNYAGKSAKSGKNITFVTKDDKAENYSSPKGVNLSSTKTNNPTKTTASTKSPISKSNQNTKTPAPPSVAKNSPIMSGNSAGSSKSSGSSSGSGKSSPTSSASSGSSKGRSK